MRTLSDVARCGAAVLVALGLAVPSLAQTPAAEWEYIGLPDRTAQFLSAYELAFKSGPFVDGSADTLYASFFSREDLSRLVLNEIGVPGGPPAGAPWTVDLHDSPEHLLVTQAGTLLGAARGGTVSVDRSTDGGRTWADGVAGGRWATCLYERPSGRGLVACGNDEAPDGPGVGYAPLVSTDDGATWRVLGQFPSGADGDGTRLGSEANALVELARAAPGGGPRLVAGVYNGIAVSDDGGATWRRSALWGPFRWYVNGFVQAEPGSPAALGTASPAQALGDTLFASARDFQSGHPVVLASTNGQAWAVRHEFEVFADPVLALGPDGALWVGATQRATARFPTVLWRSADGGRTWAPTQSGYDAYQGVSALVSGRDGRMYLAGGSGVWRTRASVVLVSEAPEAAEAPPGVSLTVHPNPSSGRVSVSLTLSGPSRAKVVVYDALGREVAVLLDGPLGGGAHTVAFDGVSLPGGVYVVRAAVTPEGGTAARALVRRITLVR